VNLTLVIVLIVFVLYVLLFWGGGPDDRE